MQTKITGMVLQTIRHNDRNDIVTLFTPQRGRVALLSPSGNSKAARLRRARLAPLAIIETEVNFRETRELQFLGDVSTPHPWHNIYFNPMKGAMAIFLGEFLNKLLRTTEPELPMWHFLLYAVNALDTLRRGMSNYHIAFLIRLLPFAGISPDMDTFKDGRYFDLQAGAFSDVPAPHRNILLPSDAKAIPMLLRMNFRNLHLFRFNVEQRRQILQWLMRYYSIHLPVSESLRSLDVLREVFT